MAYNNPEIKASKMTVTPDMAQKWLAKNTANRPLNQKKVQQWLTEMKKGAWVVSTDAIGFSTEDKLINGQHRLSALVLYGKPLDFLVAKGLHPDTFNVLDTGRTRNAGDVMGAAKMAAPHHKAAICKAIMKYRKNKQFGTGKSDARDSGFNNQEVLQFAEDNIEKLDEAYDISTATCKKFNPVKGAQLGALYWIFSEHNREDALSFFNLYSTGENLSPNSPIFLLRAKFIQNMGQRQKFPERDRMAWMIIAWNYFRQKRSVKQLRWNADNEEFPKPL